MSNETSKKQKQTRGEKQQQTSLIPLCRADTSYNIC